jgi:hypothetical protein
MSRGKKVVELKRTIADIEMGTKGFPGSCANAQCGLRLAEKAFGHPVYALSFADNYCYAVDKLNKHGELAHCLQYVHDQREWQDKFDQSSKRKLIASMIAAGETEITVTLRPPPPYKKKKSNSGPSGPHYPPEDNRGQTIPHGEIARMKRSFGTPASI